MNRDKLLKFYLLLHFLFLDMQLRLHTLSTVSQTMIIKLSVNSIQSGEQKSDEESVNQENDIELCVLKYGTNGVLEITPDFTHNRRPYTVEVSRKLKSKKFHIYCNTL